MTLTERYPWAYALAVALTSGTCFVWLWVQLSHTPVDAIDYVATLLWALLASLVIHMCGRGSAAFSLTAIANAAIKAICYRKGVL